MSDGNAWRSWVLKAAVLGLSVTQLGLADGAHPAPAAVPDTFSAHGRSARAALPPTVVYQEKFEGPGGVQMLGTYDPDLYADAYWRTAGACNGIVVGGNDQGAYTDPAGTGSCQGLGKLGTLAAALGGGNRANHALAAYTSANGPSGAVELQSPPIDVVTGGWYTAYVRYAAANCAVSSPLYTFSLVDVATGAETVLAKGIRACDYGNNVLGVKVGTIQSPRAMRWNGSGQVRLRLRNENGSAKGNDGAIDDLTLQQATPKLDKEFLPATGVRLGQPATVRFTVTNTSELAAKPDLSFTDDLAPGLVVADPAEVHNTCGGTPVATPGSGRIGLDGGELKNNQATCTIDLQVVSATRTGVISNGPDNITGNLQPPDTVTLTVSDPRAADSTATTPYHTPVTVDVLRADSAGDPAYPLVPASVVFTPDGQPPGADVSDGGKTLTVPGQGVYTVDPQSGQVAFAPAPELVGPAVPVRYQVADTNGATASAAVAVAVGPPDPTGADDTATTPYNTPVTLDPVANDDSGAPGGGFDPASVRLVDPATGQPVTTLTVPGQGTYTADPATGAIRFVPLPTFTGTATPVEYQATSTFGRPVRARATVTVQPPPPPTAADDTASGPHGRPLTFRPLANDDSGPPGTAFDPATLRLTDPATGRPATTVTVPGQGRWDLDPATATVTFTPDPDFHGQATPVPYTVATTTGGTATATLTATVRPAPTANPDTATVPHSRPATLDVLANDTPGAPFDPATVRLLDPAGNPVTTLTVPGQGRWDTDPATGRVRFTPEEGFSGTAQVPYQVSDTDGNTARSTAAVTVATPPTARPDQGTATQGHPVEFTPLANDTAGGLGSAPDPASVRLTDPATGAAVTELTVPGQGVWRADTTTGKVVFTPLPAFTGQAAPVAYTAQDADGVPFGSTMTPTVTPIHPVATPDRATTAQGHPAVLDPAANDTAGPDGPSVVPSSLRLLDDAGQPVTSLTRPGQGVFSVDTATGKVTFTPEPGFTGDARATYRVADGNGSTADAELTVHVDTPPATAPDTATTPHGHPVTVPVLANDSSDPATSLDPATETFPAAGQPPGSAVSDDGKTLTVPGEGGYAIRPDGSVVFTPADGFTGPATPVTYRVLDRDGGAGTNTLAVTVGSAPHAVDDQAATTYGTPVTAPVLGNDTTDPATSLDPATLAFPADGQPAGAVVAADGKRLELSGTGTFETTADGQVRFTPAAGFQGPTPPVRYTVRDRDGAAAGAALEVTVGTPPTARPATATGPEGTPVTVHPLADADPGSGARFDPATLRLTLDGAPAGAQLADDGRTLTVPGQGTYRAGPDGTLTFTPAAGFHGTAGPVSYTVATTGGARTGSTVTIRITETPAPPASPGPSAPATPSAPPAPSSPPAPAVSSRPGSQIAATGTRDPVPFLLAALAMLLTGAVILVKASRHR
ncbi:Ig-like domain-containing protein [Kitasatospora cineracea]|uniref:CshA-type fibril repeat protein n=1 Tax=Kitasatospora cineracea TaxID=88074 RepID=A0A8G1XEP4_9ACTN|nr:tandem-95 repeat protein [Kitasatospora cineracea]ROR46398.1 CshA-type fibril repeat protein [Kitasatospora cineracea]